MDDEKLLQLINAAIPLRKILKKTLARRCGVSKPRFSEMLHGDRPMPSGVQKRLIKELGIKEIWDRLSAPTSLDNLE
jgi:hypothetical protein